MTVEGKGGRPKIVIDYDMVKLLAGFNCTQEEIATALDISVRTLIRDEAFCRVYKKEVGEFKSTLRRAQRSKALGKDTIFLYEEGKLVKDGKGKPVVLRPGNAADTVMQIWLGKQYLEQRDQVEVGSKGNSFAIAVVIGESAKGKPFKEIVEV